MSTFLAAETSSSPETDVVKLVDSDGVSVTDKKAAAFKPACTAD